MTNTETDIVLYDAELAAFGGPALEHAATRHRDAERSYIAALETLIGSIVDPGTVEQVYRTLEHHRRFIVTKHRLDALVAGLEELVEEWSVDGDPGPEPQQ